MSLFESLVDKSVRNAELSQTETDLLMKDLPKWKSALVTKVMDIDRQLAQRKPDFPVTPSQASDYKAWRKTAVGYKVALNNKIQAVKALMRETDAPNRQDTMIDLLEELVDEVKSLHDSIYRLSNTRRGNDQW